MGSCIKYIGGVLHLLLLNPAPTVSFREEWPFQNVRVKRQEGYVYDRPSVAFDLPTRSTTVATQAPVTERTQTAAVDRTQSQYMYYAYPAPSGGDTVNIGYSTGNSGITAGSAGGGGGGSSGTNAGNGVAGGYNYGAQSTGTLATQAQSTSTTSTGSLAVVAGGYNYGTQNSGASATQTTSTSTGLSTGGSGGYNYGAQNSGTTTTQTASTGSITSGYNYNSPGPTVGNNQTPTTASTNAPQYLPPVSNGAGVGVNTGVAVNIPSGSATLSPGSTTEGSQKGLNIAGVFGTTAGYLPPLISPSSSPSPLPGILPTDTATGNPSGYLPPVVSTPGSSPTSNTISTPASTYLPPVF